MWFRKAAVWCVVSVVLGIPALLIGRAVAPPGSARLDGPISISYIEILAVGIAVTAASLAASKIGER